MSFTLPELPFAADALAPHMSKDTLDLHHGKHHRGYVAKLVDMTKDTPMAKQSVEEIVRATYGKDDQKGIFNNAAQHWNHSFFWQSLTPKKQEVPKALADALSKAFGDVETFKKKFAEAGAGQFGSGWVWLVQGKDGLSIVTTGNADTPIAHNQTPLLVCDVWEHAYYVDYQNRRPDYLKVFVDELANWEHAAELLAK